MAKQDVVTAQLAAVQQGEQDVLSQALGACFDAGEADGNGPGFTQADIDAAVLAATSPLNAQITQDASDLAAAHADADSKLADLQTKLDTMTAEDQADKAVVSNFQSSITALQNALDALKAAIPVPPPVDGSTPPSDGGGVVSTSSKK